MMSQVPILFGFVWQEYRGEIEVINAMQMIISLCISVCNKDSVLRNCSLDRLWTPCSKSLSSAAGVGIVTTACWVLTCWARHLTSDYLYKNVTIFRRNRFSQTLGIFYKGLSNWESGISNHAGLAPYSLLPAHTISESSKIRGRTYKIKNDSIRRTGEKITLATSLEGFRNP